MGMLCPRLVTQAQFIDESEKGLSFVIQDWSGEYNNIAASAKPLQACCYKPFKLND